MKNWWKILGVILIIYTIILGITAPLKPALVDAAGKAVTTAKAGQPLSMKAFGYNTHFTKSTNIEAWLTVVDSIRGPGGMPYVYPIKATSVKVNDDTKLDLSFEVPQHLPLSSQVQEANLVINTQEEGLLLRKTAVQLAQDSIEPALGKQAWAAEMNIEPLKTTKFAFPNLQFTRETIRNTYFHVPMWFTMFTLYGIALFHGIQYLRKRAIESDIKSVSYTRVGTLFGVLGLLTGGVWANFAWGEPFPIQEIKLLMVYTVLAIYFAYFILRGSFDDFEKRARLSAVYSIFSFASLVPLLYVIPKLANASSHPGNGGNSSIAAQDMDNTMRLIFYPACIGWIIIGLWVASLAVRSEILKNKILDKMAA
jgi:heme exporter protein C